ncbi:MAG: hypothetical protein JNK54_04025 [Elusimicrobia bacterium]|jgi:hypothetical protein|nr:hypothetical protein [Elusimicrobiota bacterium]
MPNPPLKRGLWILVLGVLVALISGVLYFLHVVLVDDRQIPFPPSGKDSPPLLQQSFLNWTHFFPADSPSSKTISGDQFPPLVIKHPEVNFRWVDEKSGVAQVTLVDPPGQTRLFALVAEAGSSYIWTGKLRPGTVLEFRTGILSEGVTFRFRIDLEDEKGQFHPLYSQFSRALSSLSTDRWVNRLPAYCRALMRNRGARDAQWTPARVDLSAWADRNVHLFLRVEAPHETSLSNRGLAFWGGPVLQFPAVEMQSVRRRTSQSLPEKDVVLAVLETTPDQTGAPDIVFGKDFTRFEDFLRRSTLFSRFYTVDTRLPESLRGLLFPSSVPWPTLLQERGYQTVAVGAFTEEMMSVLSEAGFDEIHQVPHNGEDSVRAAGRAVEWVRDRGRRPRLILVFFRDMPLNRISPVRFWSFSISHFPWSSVRWVLWRRASDASYRDDYVGRLMEELDPEAVVGMVSLRGVVQEPTPVRWSETERRGKVFLDDMGMGLRESEIRTLFALRHDARLGPQLQRAPGQSVNVGPLLLSALDIPLSTEKRRPSIRGKSTLREDATDPWLVRSPWAKAVIVDSRFKYIRHGPPRVHTVKRWGRPVQRRWTDFPAEEVFDLWSDPEEQHNLVRSRRHLLARLRDVMEDLAPDPVDIRFGFLNPKGDRLRGVVTCSGGKLVKVGGTFPFEHRGDYEFSFSTDLSSGTFTFGTFPPDSSYSFRFHVNGRPLPSSQLLVSRWGLPFFESTWNEWHDKTNFGWMEGWAPPPASLSPVGSLGRVPLTGNEGSGTELP